MAHFMISFDLHNRRNYQPLYDALANWERFASWNRSDCSRTTAPRSMFAMPSISLSTGMIPLPWSNWNRGRAGQRPREACRCRVAEKEHPSL